MALRAEGLAGLAGAALFLAGFGLLSGAPAPGEALEEVVPYLEGHRERIFAATILLGFGSCAFFLYLAGLRRVAGLASVLGAVSGTMLVLVGMSLLSGLVLHVPDARLALLGFDLFNALVTMGGFGFGFSLVAAAMFDGPLPAGYRRTALAIGVLQLATIPGLAVEHGFFAPLGGMAVAAFWLLTAWYAAVALRMVQISRGAPKTGACAQSSLSPSR